MTMIMSIVRLLLKPLKQPEIVSLIIGGVILGPSFLGRNKMFATWAFPLSSQYMTTTFSKIGTLSFLFLSGVKQDPSLLKKSGRKAVVIALSGWSLSLGSTLSMASIIGKHVNVVADIGGFGFYNILATTIAVTNFPVAHPILAEFNLLNSDLGRLAMAASMITDLIAWVGFIFDESLRRSKGNPLMLMSYLVSLAILLIIIIYVFRPVMKSIVKRTPNGRLVEKRYIAPILLSVFVVTFFCDFLGGRLADGLLFLGLAVPDGLPLGAAIVRSYETINNIFFLPFYFIGMGRLTNIFLDSSWKSWWALQIIICSGYIGKTVGTILACLFYKMSWNDTISLGLIMNFRGIMELFTYSHWVADKLILQSAFPGLVFSTVMVTAVTTFLVNILNGNSRRYLAYNRRTVEHFKYGTELGILTCIHGNENIPSIINLLEASNSTRENPICVYAFHLVELVGRSIPVFVAHDSQRKSSHPTNDEHFVKAFRNYEQHKGGQICIQPFTMVSPYKTMHEDICKFALDKKVNLIIIPFYKQQTIMGNREAMDSALRTVNPSILENAPCSVGVLVDRGGVGNKIWATLDNFSYSIAIIYLGGKDDREALAYASRMTKHPQVSLTVVRFLQANSKEDSMRDMEFDNKLLEEFRYRNSMNEHVVYIEEIVQDGPEMVTMIHSMGNGYDLMMTGLNHSSKSELLNGLSEFSESPELGVVGDILASPDFFGGIVSVLVVQQQTQIQTVVFKI
ncbi:cation/H(+) antiporter 15-like [Tasmannia lanceolata]|uniref:cation/H(+) antiporter 15-like n=1 Tax=Tasmannia lanceolata TaxID=3420 RepID=UPI0040631065